MRKLLSVFLAGMSAFTCFPATIWASAETTYESEQGQAMIKLHLRLLQMLLPILKPMSILQMTPKVL